MAIWENPEILAGPEQPTVDGQQLKPEVGIIVLHQGIVTMEWAYRFKLLQSPPFIPIFLKNQPYDCARETGTRNALTQGVEYIFYLDSDVCVSPDAIIRMMEMSRTNNVPVISGVYWAKQPGPPHVAAWKSITDELWFHNFLVTHKCKEEFIKNQLDNARAMKKLPEVSDFEFDIKSMESGYEKLEDGDDYKKSVDEYHKSKEKRIEENKIHYLPLNLNEFLGQNRLFACDVVGAGCLLVRADVFKKLDESNPNKPFFQWGVGRKDENTGKPLLQLSEDFYFCERLKEIGILPHVATAIKCDHICVCRKRSDNGELELIQLS